MAEEILLNKELAMRVLTLSVSYDPPAGGIAQLVNTYSKIYPVFNHVATVAGGSWIRKTGTFFVAILRFLNFCMFRGIKIVHIHGASNNSFFRKRIFICMAKLMRKKIVFHIHGGGFKEFYEKNKKSVISSMRKADAVVALSNSWAEFFSVVVVHPRVRVIENVVPVPAKVKLAKDDRTHFLFLGDFAPQKGIFDILAAMAENRATLSGSALLHIGGRGDVDGVMRRVQDLGLESSVILEGWVSGDSKARLFNLADVFILPSYKEGLPISILEAMSYGLPVISTPVGGIPEVIAHDANGLLVTPGDLKSLGKAMARMVEDVEFRRWAGVVSSERIQPYFPDNVLAKLEALYREILE
jgi:glycosyltransferase involved in cell wall biosynthesis